LLEASQKISVTVHIAPTDGHPNLPTDIITAFQKKPLVDTDPHNTCFAIFGEKFSDPLRRNTLVLHPSRISKENPSRKIEKTILCSIIDTMGALQEFQHQTDNIRSQTILNADDLQHLRNHALCLLARSRDWNDEISKDLVALGNAGADYQKAIQYTRDGSENEVKILSRFIIRDIAQGKIDRDAKLKHDDTAIILAAKAKRLILVRSLIKAGVDCTKAIQHAQDPAIEKAMLEDVVDKMMETPADASFDKKLKNDLTALALAKKRKWPHLEKKLLEVKKKLRVGSGGTEAPAEETARWRWWRR
jgi:hypothetical protein